MIESPSLATQIVQDSHLRELCNKGVRWTKCHARSYVRIKGLSARLIRCDNFAIPDGQAHAHLLGNKTVVGLLTEHSHTFDVNARTRCNECRSLSVSIDVAWLPALASSSFHRQQRQLQRFGRLGLHYCTVQYSRGSAGFHYTPSSITRAACP